MSEQPTAGPESRPPRKPGPRTGSARGFDIARFFSGTFLGMFVLFLAYVVILASAGPYVLSGPCIWSRRSS